MLCLSATACGGAGKGAGSSSQHFTTAAAAGGAATTTSSGAAPEAHLPLDADNDNDNLGKSHYDSDDGPVLYFGHAANAAEGRTITVLVKHYYAAAAANDGATACSLIYSIIAESVADEYGQSPALSGKTCAVVMSKLFKQRHRELATEAAGLEVTRMRVSGDRGLVLLRLGTALERRVPVRREHGAWRLAVLFDVGVP